MDIHGKIRDVLAETVRDDEGSKHRSLSEADFLHALQRRGIVDDVMKDLHFTKVSLHFAHISNICCIFKLELTNSVTFAYDDRKQPQVWDQDLLLSLPLVL